MYFWHSPPILYITWFICQHINNIPCEYIRTRFLLFICRRQGASTLNCSLHIIFFIPHITKISETFLVWKTASLVTCIGLELRYHGFFSLLFLQQNEIFVELSRGCGENLKKTSFQDVCTWLGFWLKCWAINIMFNNSRIVSRVANFL